MNKILVASVAVALSGLIGTPAPAEARGNEAAAAIGGFIGGVIVGATISDHRAPPPPPIVVTRPGPAVHVGVVVGHGHGHGRRHGHWEWTTVRVWVPGHWTWVEGRYGRKHRVWVDGHYDRRRERVWVEHRGRHCRSC